MKKHIIYSVLFAIFFLYSCNKNIEADLAYHVNVDVYPKDVIGSFTPYVDDDFYMLDGDVVRINLFIYAEDGSLVEKHSQKLKSYSDKAAFAFKLPVGNYTFIATSDIYTPSYDFEIWNYYDTDNINTLSIKQNYRFGPDALLGLKMIETEIKEPTDIEIPLTSATALINWRMKHIHDDNIIFEDIFLFEKYYISLDGKYNEALTIENNEFNAVSAPTGYYYHIASLSPLNFPNSENIYHYSAILPIERTTIMITAELVDLETEESGLIEYPFVEPVSTSFKGGKQYVIEVDYEEGTLEVYNGMSKLNTEAKSNASISNKVGNTRLMDVINYNPELKLNKLSK